MAEAKTEGKETKKEDDNPTEGDGDEKEGKTKDVGSDEEMKEDKKQGAEEEKKKNKYPNWPLRDVKEPHENDVLYGRGGGTNHHPGNKRYRKMVEERKLDYVNSKRLDKPLVALDIIRKWRAQEPPGRFLKLEEKTGLWHDVGDKKAREKTSQALREKAPEIRRKQEEEQMAKEGKEPPSNNAKEANNSNTTKTTRFAEGTKEQSSNVNKVVLARDHSLGREYLKDGEAVTLDGFTWDSASMERMSSFGSVPGGGPPPPPPPPPHSAGYYPPGRITSHGSTGMPPPSSYAGSRAGSVSSLPPPDAYYPGGRVFSGPRHDSWSRIPSTGSANGGMPPPPPPIPGYGSPYGAGPREHSLAHNPLRDASITQPANRNAFDNRSGSGYWGDMPPPPPHAQGGPTSSTSSYGRYMSGSENYSAAAAPPGPPTSGGGYGPPPASYSVDPMLAQTWSSKAHDPPNMFYPEGGDSGSGADNVEGNKNNWSGNKDGALKNGQNNMTTPGRQNGKHDEPNALPRPDTVKRMTSNQNENVETKRTIKRAALNRDNSMASNRLKAQYVPGAVSQPSTSSATPPPPPAKPFDPEEEVRILSTSMEQSTLDNQNSNPAARPNVRPNPLSSDARTSTLDHVAMEALLKPGGLSSSDRTSTIDALGIVLDDDDPVLKPQPQAQPQTSPQEEPVLARPPSIRTKGRLSTAEYQEIVNEPIGGDEEDQYGIQAV